MITLTIPESIKTQLGGVGSVSYERFVADTFTFSTSARTVKGRGKLISTSVPSAEPVFGDYEFLLGPGTLKFRMDQKSVARRLELSGAQVTAVQNVMNDVQNALESGFITLQVILGTQSPGA